MSSTHKYFMQIAAELCSKSDVKKYQHGAVLVGPGSELISLGYNHYVSEALFCLTEHRSMHAERHAIYSALNARKNIKGTILYVVRVNKRKQFRNSKPCMHCTKQILKHGVKTIYYSISETNIAKIETVSMENVDDICKSVI